MIFRWLYKRKVTRLFGRFVPESTIKDVTESLSEWESLKLLLPRAVSRLFFSPVVSEIDALRTVQEMIGDVLHDAPHVASNKHSPPNSPRKPD